MNHGPAAEHAGEVKRSPGLLPGVGAWAPLVALYRTLWRLERGFFRSFPFLVHRCRAPVVSVGNLSMGGTGKTPVLFALLHELTGMGASRLAVLTRGYRSRYERSCLILPAAGYLPEGLTDETVLLRRRFPHVAIGVGKNRAHAARLLESLVAPELILLDDGLQYRRLRRDIDLVCIDITRPPAVDRLLPAGRLREPVERLREASALLLTRAEQVAPAAVAEVEEWLAAIAPAVPRVVLETQPVGWVDGVGAEGKAPSRCFAFAAIGHPEAFSRQLVALGAQVIGERWFRDHHRFSAGDLEAVAAAATQCDATLVCTEKDLVKLPVAWAQQHRLRALVIAMQPRGGGSLVAALARGGVKFPVGR